jgi:hypothetical protein
LPPALLDIEPGLGRIRGYCHLPALHHALQVELNLLSNCEENRRSATMGATSISLKIEYCFYYTLILVGFILFKKAFYEIELSVIRYSANAILIPNISSSQRQTSLNPLEPTLLHRLNFHAVFDNSNIFIHRVRFASTSFAT